MAKRFSSSGRGRVLLLSVLIWASVTIGLDAFGVRGSPRVRTWTAAENRNLVGFAFAEKTASSRVVCARECSMNHSCSSFNFYHANKRCVLNNATKSGRLGNFAVVGGSVYFDTDEDTPSFSVSNAQDYRSCKTLLEANVSSASGVYTIYPDDLSGEGMRVYCDMDTDGGGWLVFQRRQDGSVDFYRNWADYQSGFGELDGEFWLGNEQLARLTSSGVGGLGPWQLRVDLGDWQGQTAWAKFDDFQIYGELYTLSFSIYDPDSTAGNSLSWHKGLGFTTRDNDNDHSDYNCAISREGAWWFNQCETSHLNGRYILGGITNSSNLGIVWDRWRGDIYSLKNCSMKLREIEI